MTFRSLARTSALLGAVAALPLAGCDLAGGSDEPTDLTLRVDAIADGSAF